MKMKKTNSSIIKEVGYDGKDLYINLTTNSNYKYENVPSKVYKEFLKADSLGQYFNKNIRNSYKYVRM